MIKFSSVDLPVPLSPTMAILQEGCVYEQLKRLLGDVESEFYLESMSIPKLNSLYRKSFFSPE